MSCTNSFDQTESDEIMASLEYKKGDLFLNLEKDKKILIAHIANDLGEMGGGFADGLTKNLPENKTKYKNDIANTLLCNGDPLGTVSFYQHSYNLRVANMVAQHRHIGVGEKRPIRYVALMECMRKVKLCMNGKYGPEEIYCPKFGSDRARGHWPTIEALIEELWVSKGIDVTVFEL